jgi:phospho-N-acetylmuramoyl-pentapeptide-transferase
MLYYLSELSSYFSPLNVFQYMTFRAMGAALTSLLLSLWIGPTVIRMLTRLKLGQPIRGKDEVNVLADLHGSKKGTPTMGGIMILITLTISCVLWGVPTNSLLWLTLGATLLLGGLGFVDDYKKIKQKKSDGISSRQKLMVQTLVAGGVGAFLLLNGETRTLALAFEIPYAGYTFIDPTGGWIALVFFIFIIVGASNAVNLTDGLDGLASGCTVSVALVYSLFAYLMSNVIAANYLKLTHVAGATELVIYCAALGGSALGFLWYNCHPAKMFMGDTGSLAIGGGLGTVAICLNQEILLAIVGAVFVMEAGSVILQVASFKLTGKRIFAMSPLHHHFEIRGWSETSVVVRFWILSLVFAIIGLTTLKLR